MKRYSLIFSCFIALVTIFSLLPNKEVKSQEVDYIASAIAALQTSNVYVAPGTPGTDYNTTDKLKVFLKPEDNIILVMLPPNTIDGTDMLAVAQKISAGLDNQKTIGLAVGREVIGYSTIIPEGVAQDKMSRANSVSNDPITALITFTQNIHSWLLKNPQPTSIPTPKPTPTPRPTMQPIELPKTNDVPLPIWIAFLFGFIVVIVTIAVQIKKARDKSKYDSIISDLENN